MKENNTSLHTVVQIKVLLDEILEDLFTNKSNSLHHLVSEGSSFNEYFDYEVNAWNEEDVFVAIYEGSWAIGSVNIGNIHEFNETKLKELEDNIYKLVDDYLSENE